VTAETKCRLWVMERAVYVAIKRTYTAQLATQKRELLDRVPMLGTLSQVRARLACRCLPTKTGDLCVASVPAAGLAAWYA